MKLHDTYLVQRMRRPRSYNVTDGVKPHHVFGGSALGLSKEAWEILDSFCTLDYMGAAEYEAWGGPGPVPQAFNRLAEWASGGKLETFAFVIGPHQRALNWHRGYAKKNEVLPPAKFVTIFGIVHEELFDEAQERIRTLAKDERSFNVKQGTRLTASLDPLSEYEVKDPVCGWLELNNTFLFFSDRKMWESCCEFFELQKCEVPQAPVLFDFSKMKKPELVDAAMSMGMFAFKADAKRIKAPELRKLLTEAQEEASAGLLP
jgi:hypothetical protein